jgi:hypothetical protein
VMIAVTTIITPIWLKKTYSKELVSTWYQIFLKINFISDYLKQ